VNKDTEAIYNMIDIVQQDIVELKAEHAEKMQKKQRVLDSLREQLDMLEVLDEI